MGSPGYGDTLYHAHPCLQLQSVLGMTSVASTTISFQDLKASAANRGALIARTLIYEGLHGARTWTTMLAGKDELHV